MRHGAAANNLLFSSDHVGVTFPALQAESFEPENLGPPCPDTTNSRTRVFSRHSQGRMTPYGTSFCVMSERQLRPQRVILERVPDVDFQLIQVNTVVL